MPQPAPSLDLCTPERPNPALFNPRAVIPFGVTTEHLCRAMTDFTDFLGSIDRELCLKGMARLEDMLMPANFSSIVGEFMGATIPRYCISVAKNTYHNGHPDILPAGKYLRNSAQHAGADGIEIKASRYPKGWQGHNQEDVWLMVFIFDSGRPDDVPKKRPPVKFRFKEVLGGPLKKSDWKFSGRSESSRRTITASVLQSGYDKMCANWIYRSPSASR